jgi:hemerythrin-like domain-containing protein
VKKEKRSLDFKIVKGLGFEVSSCCSTRNSKPETRNSKPLNKMSKPIKRSPALMPLSREHHFDLLLAWKIRKGLKNDVSTERIANYIQYLNKNLISDHFKDEEELLFNRLSSDDQLCDQARQEHNEIRKLIAAICIEKRKDAALFNELADKVEAHVRFEERKLFPYLEQKLSPEKLQEIEKVIEEKHGGFQEVWEDEFWI